jgi:hypothetical protein
MVDLPEPDDPMSDIDVTALGAVMLTPLITSSSP